MYVDVLIHSGNLVNYYEYIPEYYRTLILKGKASAVATYDGGMEKGCFVGVSVTGNDAGWLDIVWIAMGKDYGQIIQEADFIRYVLARAERTGEYTGAYTEVHEEEFTPRRRDTLILSGMELRMVKNNLYECRLGDLAGMKQLGDPPKDMDCIFLEDTPDEFLDALAEKMEEDERPVPISAFPEWEIYMQKLSLICVEKDVPSGALLFTEEGDYLVLSLCYSTAAKHMAVMIKTAYDRAMKYYTEEKRILIPIVGTNADKIVEKLAPSAVRGNIIQAVVWFEKETPEGLDPVMKQMLGKGWL